MLAVSVLFSANSSANSFSSLVAAMSGPFKGRDLTTASTTWQTSLTAPSA
jgi:hypothetical protein